MTEEIKIRYMSDLTTSNIDHVEENRDLFIEFFKTCGLDRNGFEFFRAVGEAAELHIKNDRIIKVVEHWAEEILVDDDDLELECDIAPPVANWKDHSPFFLVKDENGPHQIGGNPPDYFTMPHHEAMSFPMQYLCRIDCTDPKFEWMGIPELNIVASLYDYFGELHIDYSDYRNPKILNPETFNEPNSFPEMKMDGNVVFKRFNLATAENDNPLKYAEMYEDNELVVCGLPSWQQGFNIFRCPVTGEPMKFVCMIPSDENVTIENVDAHTNLVEPTEYLDFGGGGYLFIFFHPKSKVAHIELFCS